MQEWDPEHFTSFEHLCEVTLGRGQRKDRGRKQEEDLPAAGARRPSSISFQARAGACSA